MTGVQTCALPISFGAVSIEGKQIFRQYDVFNGDTFLEFLKKIHARFPKCYLFMDKASPHYKSKKVLKYFEENKDTIIPVYLPTASPEFMVMEEIWNIAKRDLFVLQYYQSFADLKNKVSGYFRAKRFNLDMRNYLLSEVRQYMLIGIDNLTLSYPVTFLPFTITSNY